MELKIELGQGSDTAGDNSVVTFGYPRIMTCNNSLQGRKQEEMEW
jgi:hypothetical protein